MPSLTRRFFRAVSYRPRGCQGVSSDESVVRASSDPSTAEFSPLVSRVQPGAVSHIRVVRCGFSAWTAAGASGRPESASSSGKSVDLP